MIGLSGPRYETTISSSSSTVAGYSRNHVESHTVVTQDLDTYHCKMFA